jgi:type III secretion protein S
MDSTVVIDACYRALTLVLLLSLPAVLTSAIIGLGTAILQAVTQIQDQGLSQAIKLVCVMIVLALSSKWIGTELYHTADQLFSSVGLGGADVR